MNEVFKKESEPAERLKFKYSVESEIRRLNYHLNGDKDYNWYKENGYNLSLPKKLVEIVDSGRMPDPDEIEDAAKEDFDENIFTDEIYNITEEWKNISTDFFKKLEELGGPIHDEYSVSLSRYGTLGSYGLPNFIALNISKDNPMGIGYVIAHEITHLTIESWVLESGLDHWTKERIVDLIMNSFFPDNQRFQHNPANLIKISKIFKDNFPDIKKVISEVSLL